MSELVLRPLKRVPILTAGGRRYRVLSEDTGRGYSKITLVPLPQEPDALRR